MVVVLIAIAIFLGFVAINLDESDFRVVDCADCFEGIENPECVQCQACFAQNGRASRKRRFLGKKTVTSKGRELHHFPTQEDADDFGEVGPKDFRDPEEDKAHPITVTMADGETMTLVPRATFKKYLKVYTVYDVVEAE